MSTDCFSMATEHPPTPESIMDLGFSDNVETTSFPWHVKTEELEFESAQFQGGNLNAGNSNDIMFQQNQMPMQQHHLPQSQSFAQGHPQQLGFGGASFNANVGQGVNNDDDHTTSWLAGLELGTDFGPLDSEWALPLGPDPVGLQAGSGPVPTPFSGQRKSSVLLASGLFLGSNGFLPRASQLPPTTAKETAATTPTTAAAAQPKTKKATVGSTRPAPSCASAGPDMKRLKRIHKTARRSIPTPRSVPSVVAKPVKKTTQRSREQSSKYRGVSRCSKDGRFQSRIRVGPKVIYLGRFKNEVEAARAYDAAAIQYHEKRASLNFPNDAEVSFASSVAV